MHTTFNLARDQWVPVYRQGGQNGLASLRAAFADNTIVDLCADPCERIALMRLLLAISHRALDIAGQHPDEPIKPQVIRERLTQCVPRYLDAQKVVFDLGDENGGFLRLPNVTAAKPPETPAAEYLQFQKGAKAKHLSPDQVALGVITFQCCYPGGLCARNLSLEGKSLSSVSAACSPSIEGGPLYSFVIGQTLLDTIARNLLPKSAFNHEFGVPAWEELSTTTFLGRLLPLAYSIVFSPGFDTMSYGPVPYSYQAGTPDPWLAYRATPKGSAVVRINAEKSLWRELPTITAIPEPGKRQGSLLLQQSRNLEGAQLWVGGLAKYQADVLTLTESRFELSESMLENLRAEGYLKAFRDAETMAKKLVSAIKAYFKEATHSNPKGPTPGVPDAQMRYWNRLDVSKQMLFDLMATNDDPAPWTRHCLQVARRVLDEVCDPSNAREYQAITIAHSKLTL